MKFLSTKQKTFFWIDSHIEFDKSKQLLEPSTISNQSQLIFRLTNAASQLLLHVKEQARLLGPHRDGAAQSPVSS